MEKRTKIVCTLGPASDSLLVLQKMILAGMNVARLNFAHGTHESHLRTIKNLRQLMKKTGKAVTIIQDLEGPKIRTGELPSKGILLKDNSQIVFDTSLTKMNGKVVPIRFSNLHKHLKKGERMFFDDGRMSAVIKSVKDTVITAKVVNGGILLSNKGINLPDSKLVISSLTEKDKADLIFGVKNQVDIVDLSFVNTAQDILDLRFLITEYEKKFKIISEQPIRIIAKIERQQAVKNIKEILQVADGIMIARGDLGVEIPPEKVPLVQKQLIDECLLLAKPVIVATQMLDSMQNNPRPTRAEVSDVANAVVDHADAVMLSGETSTGKYPVETVKMMSSIVKETEASIYDDLEEGKYMRKRKKIDEVVSEMSKMLAEQVGAKLILAASLTGETARLISRHRPELSIVVATSSERVKNQLNLSWGVVPFFLNPCRTIEELIQRSMVYIKKQKLVKKGDEIIIVSGEPVGQAGHVNLLEVREVS